MTPAPDPIADDDVDRRLTDLAGWRREGGEIFKWFRFGSFPEAIAFLGRLVEPCERLNHHPDIESHFDRVRVGLHTWSVSAITEKDLALAAEIERVAGSA